MKKDVVKRAFHLTIPVMMGYVFVAVAFSILMNEKGMSPLYSLLMSVFVYAGSMQFAAVELLCGGAGLFQAAFMTLMVNIRHIFYGLGLMEPYQKMKKEKFYFIHSLSDETYSLLCTQDKSDKTLLVLIGAFNQLYWVIGTLLGSLLSEWLFFDTTGIDFAMNALFIVIFIEQWQSSSRHLPAVLGVVLSLLCLIVFGKDQMVLMSMILILASLLALRKIEGGSAK